MHRASVDTNILLRLLIKDDDIKKKACERLLEKAKLKEIHLYILPIVVMEIVWVLEKYYKLDRKTVRELAEAVMNTPELHIEMEDVFRKALRLYEEKNVKFADAVIGYWGLENDISIVYTYDERDFKNIKDIEVRKP